MSEHHPVEEYCSFCGKPVKEVEVLVTAPTTSICDECIRVCNEILEETKLKALIRRVINEDGFAAMKKV
jgi:ATP-dependent protease Clp ATPase subunit